jgi:hypothetical protein
MQFFLNRVTEHLEQGLDRQGEGHIGQVRHHHLRAAEHLFKAACRGSGGERLCVLMPPIRYKGALPMSERSRRRGHKRAKGIWIKHSLI